jgi:hypothetical protein
MAQDEQFSGLFDMASKKQGKKEKEIAFSKKPMSEKEIQEEFLRCKTMYEEIKIKIEGAYKNAEVTPKQVQDYLAEPSHFSEGEFEQVQKMRKENKVKLGQLLPKNPEAEMKPQEGGEKTKSPKGFVSKKRWLSMQ